MFDFDDMPEQMPEIPDVEDVMDLEALQKEVMRCLKRWLCKIAVGRTGGGVRTPLIASAFGDTDGEIFGRKIFQFFDQKFRHPYRRWRKQWEGSDPDPLRTKKRRSSGAPPRPVRRDFA